MKNLEKYGLANLSLITGGFDPGDTKISKHKTYKDSNGCTVTEMESWVDADDDGFIDRNETVSECITRSDCPQ